MDVDFLLRAIQVATVKYVDETWGNFREIEGTKLSMMQKWSRLLPDRMPLRLSKRSDFVSTLAGS